MDATAKLILAVLIIFPVYCFAMTCTVRGLHKAVLRLKLKQRIEKRVQDVYNAFPPLVYNPSLVQQLSPKIGTQCDSSLVLQHNHQNQQMHVSDQFESVVLQEEDLDASTLVFSQPEMFRIENEILFVNNTPVSLLSDLLKADGSPLLLQNAGTSINGSGDIIQNGAVIMNIKDIFVKNIDGNLTSLQTASEFSVSDGVVYFKQKPLCRAEDVINSGDSFSNKSIIISANGSVFSDGTYRGCLRDLYFQNTKRLLDSSRFQVLDGTLCHDMKPLCRLQDARDRNGGQVPDDAFVSTCGCVFSGGKYICDASDLTVNTDTGKQSVEIPSPFRIVGGVVFRGESEYCKLHTNNITDGLTISSNGSMFKELKYLGNVRSSSEFKVENGTLFQSGRPLCQIENITTKNIAVLQNGAVYENTKFLGRVENLEVEVFGQKCLLDHNMFQIEGGIVYFDKIPDKIPDNQHFGHETADAQEPTGESNAAAVFNQRRLGVLQRRVLREVRAERGRGQQRGLVPERQVRRLPEAPGLQQGQPEGHGDARAPRGLQEHREAGERGELVPGNDGQMNLIRTILSVFLFQSISLIKYIL
ncbi:Hypothetical_protein [Hexamita inflata]|uniref:Hypothetical_protein n=1 Tax=Hexamita inflata TaxID=28002 RepID=A0AA86Q0X1_9EUKA|nr:Hypothetical protein HINF_LOCUS35292 [Hexamita inflata]